ncbi:hypothetical protein [Caballeronia sp. GAWG1-5s-s]|nr:hypothetical protein [Caballeronia sp. GAWG1-5s-s]
MDAIDHGEFSLFAMDGDARGKPDGASANGHIVRTGARCVNTQNWTILA